MPAVCVKELRKALGDGASPENSRGVKKESVHIV
jgi:hypothetical protein